MNGDVYRMEEDLKILQTIMRKRKNKSSASADSGDGIDEANDDGEGFQSKEEFANVMKNREAELEKALAEGYFEKKQGEISLMRRLDLIFFAFIFFSVYIFVKIKFGFDLFLYFISPKK